MEEQAARDALALPGAAGAFARLADELDAGPATVLTRESDVQRARALAEAVLEGIASGRTWDDVDDVTVPDDELVAALLPLSAALMHLGAEVAGVEPLQFLHDALRRVPPPG